MVFILGCTRAFYAVRWRLDASSKVGLFAFTLFSSSEIMLISFLNYVLRLFQDRTCIIVLLSEPVIFVLQLVSTHHSIGPFSCHKHADIQIYMKCTDHIAL